MSTSPNDQGLVDEDLELFAEEYALTEELETLRQAASRLDSDLDDDPTHSKWAQPAQMYLCIVATGLAAMTLGWIQTAINGAGLYVPDYLEIGTFLTGLINCATYLANGLLGCLLVAPVNARLGRRGTVFLGALMQLVFWVVGAFVSSWQPILACRLAVGVGLGLVTTSVNVFVAECAPPAIRGGLSVVWQLMVAFGVFIGFAANMLIDSSLNDETVYRWRIMLVVAVAPAIPLLALIFACPESPAWLIKARRRYNLAYMALCRIRNTRVEAAEQLLRLREHERRMTSNTGESSTLQDLRDIFVIPRLRRATLAAYTPMLAQQICGINIGKESWCDIAVV